MKDNFMRGMQEFARAIIVPVLFLPIVGILLALTSILTNPSIVAEGTFLFNVGEILSGTLWPIMNNLSILFCVGIALGMAKEKKAEAALLAVFSYFLFLGSNNTWLAFTNRLIEYKDTFELYGTGQTVQLGFQVVDMGVFLGMILGLVVAKIHNKYCNVEFPGALAMYGNTKLVFMVLIPVIIVLSIALSYIWPLIASVIGALTNFITLSGAFGVFLYGFLNRFLIPTGLHHLLWAPFMYSELGGSLVVNGKTFQGAFPIFIAQLSDPSVTMMHESTKFLLFGITKMFGLIGVALAMYHTARSEKKGEVKALLIPALATAVLTGITEPLEFTFLFVAPALWLIYSTVDGLTQMILSLLNVRVCGNDGIINLLIYNLPAGVSKTKWPLFIVVGLVEAFVLYHIFKAFILKFNVKTPGRQETEEKSKLMTKKDYKKAKANTEADDQDIAKIIIAALGGKKNIKSVNNCFTRLRVDLEDLSLFDKDSIMEKTGASGVAKQGSTIQIIYGLNVNKIRNSVEKELNI